MKNHREPGSMRTRCAAVLACAVLLTFAADSGPAPARPLTQRKAPRKGRVSPSPRTTAATNFIINGGFEEGFCPGSTANCNTEPPNYACIPENGFTFSDMPDDPEDADCKLYGWGYDYWVDLIVNNYPCHNSSRCIDLGGGAGGGSGYCASITQDVLLTAGETYCLTFYMAGNYGGGPEVKRMKVLAGGKSATVEFSTCCIDNPDVPANMTNPHLIILTSDKWKCSMIQFKGALPVSRKSVPTRIKFIDAGGGQCEGEGCEKCTPDAEGNSDCDDKQGSGCTGFGPLLDNISVVPGPCPATSSTCTLVAK